MHGFRERYFEAKVPIIRNLIKSCGNRFLRSELHGLLQQLRFCPRIRNIHFCLTSSRCSELFYISTFRLLFSTTSCRTSYLVSLAFASVHLNSCDSFKLFDKSSIAKHCRPFVRPCVHFTLRSIVCKRGAF